MFFQGPGERAVIQMDKLGDLLDSKGGIKDIKSTVSFVNQMKDACKLPCRFIFLYVIEATNEEVLTDFMKNGGWSVVSHWLQDAKTKDNKALINCLLNICKILPVSVEQMKENNCAKLIKSISKTDNSDLKNLAKSIVEKWKNAVKNEGSMCFRHFGLVEFCGIFCNNFSMFFILYCIKSRYGFSFLKNTLLFLKKRLRKNELAVKPVFSFILIFKTCTSIKIRLLVLSAKNFSSSFISAVV